MFQKLLNKKKIKKEYHSFVKGKTKIKFNTLLKENILHKYNKKIKNTPKLTKNQYHLIKNYTKYSLIKIFLITGKTHQIRIHLTHIGYPIIYDQKYGNKIINKKNTQILLHSKSIKFKCPINKKKFYIKAKYNINFKNFITTIKEKFKNDIK